MSSLTFVHRVTHLTYRKFVKHADTHMTGKLFAHLKSGSILELVLHVTNTSTVVNVEYEFEIEHDVPAFDENTAPLGDVSLSFHDVTSVSLTDTSEGKNLKLDMGDGSSAQFHLFLTSMDT